MELSFLNRSDPLTPEHLERSEEIALSGSTLPHLLAARLLAEVLRLRYEIADPRYSYAGSRIHRFALLSRDAEIGRLCEEVRGLRCGK